MTAGFVAVCLLVLSLAWANGANDVAKGVATLAGAGIAHARRAILWGVACSMLGGVAALVWGTALVSTFSTGFLAHEFAATPTFVASVVAGAALWVTLATVLALPVSTTHALLGGIIGAALALAGPDGLRVGAVANKALLPLLVSPLVAIALCALLLWLARRVERHVPAWTPGCCDQSDWLRDPYLCRTDARRARTPAERLWTALHWLSGGATSFARGLNDVPKIAALLVPALALLPGAGLAGSPPHVWPIVAVTVVMGIGSLWGGFRILPVLAQRVTRMDTRTGLVANVGTSALVLAASPLGLPVSTTHVSTGSLLGIRWAERASPGHGDALKLILFGWVVTLPVAAAVAAACCWLARMLFW